MPGKAVPSASKASAKPKSKAEKEKSESKSQIKKMENLEKYLDEIQDLMEEQQEISKKLNALFRKCATSAGVVKSKKPQSKTAYITTEWKKFCHSTFPDRVEKETEFLREKRREEGKNDERGLKTSAITIVANNTKLTDKDMFDRVALQLEKAYVEKYLPSFGIANAGAGKAEADATEGEESEDDADASAGSEPEDEEETVKPKAKSARSVSPTKGSKKTVSKKKVSIADSLLADTDE